MHLYCTLSSLKITVKPWDLNARRKSQWIIGECSDRPKLTACFVIAAKRACRRIITMYIVQMGIYLRIDEPMKKTRRFTNSETPCHRKGQWLCSGACSASLKLSPQRRLGASFLALFESRARASNWRIVARIAAAPKQCETSQTVGAPRRSIHTRYKYKYNH